VNFLRSQILSITSYCRYLYPQKSYRHPALRDFPRLTVEAPAVYGHWRYLIAKVRIFHETRKYLWNNLLFSEFSRDSAKKNALFFVFAARKFANIGNNAYLCSVKGGTK